MGKKPKNKRWNRLRVNMRRFEDGAYMGSATCLTYPDAIFVHSSGDPVEVARTLAEHVRDELIENIGRISRVDSRPPQDRG